MINTKTSHREPSQVRTAVEDKYHLNMQKAEVGHQRSPGLRLVQTLVAAAMLSGLLNLAPTPFSLTIVVLDGLGALMLIVAVIIAARRGGHIERWMGLWLMAVLVNCEASRTPDVESARIRTLHD